jgi:hypothetical protein
LDISKQDSGVDSRDGTDSSGENTEVVRVNKKSPMRSKELSPLENQKQQYLSSPVKRGME